MNDVEIVIEAIKETIDAIDGFSYKINPCSGHRHRPVIIDITSRLIREDGLIRAKVIGSVAWRKKDYLMVLGPHDSIYRGTPSSSPTWVGHPTKDLGTRKVFLADPDWDSKFKKILSLLKSQACNRQGENGKKTRKNLLKWR